MCCRTLLDPAAREVLKPTLLELCRQSFKQLLDKEKAAQAKQVKGIIHAQTRTCTYFRAQQSSPSPPRMCAGFSPCLRLLRLNSHCRDDEGRVTKMLLCWWD